MAQDPNSAEPETWIDLSLLDYAMLVGIVIGLFIGGCYLMDSSARHESTGDEILICVNSVIHDNRSVDVPEAVQICGKKMGMVPP